MACNKVSFWVLCIIAEIHFSPIISCLSCCPIPPQEASNAKFHQKATKYWEFDEKTKSWVEISYPFDLMSCIDGNCTRVGSIEKGKQEDLKLDRDDKIVEDNFDQALPIRKRLSLTRMSESSLWVTGQSGSIYERFWNGIEWVIAPHELPSSAGQAISVFIVNQTILSLSELGILYKLQLNENSQPIWAEFTMLPNPNTCAVQTERRATIRIKSGRASHDGE